MSKIKLRDNLGLTGFGFAVVFLAGCIAVFAVSVTIAITLGSRNCAYASKQYQRATHYDWLAGCYIAVGHGRSVSLDQYQAFQRVAP